MQDLFRKISSAFGLFTGRFVFKEGEPAKVEVKNGTTDKTGEPAKVEVKKGTTDKTGEPAKVEVKKGTTDKTGEVARDQTELFAKLNQLNNKRAKGLDPKLLGKGLVKPLNIPGVIKPSELPGSESKKLTPEELQKKIQEREDQFFKDRQAADQQREVAEKAKAQASAQPAAAPKTPARELPPDDTPAPEREPGQSDQEYQARLEKLADYNAKASAGKSKPEPSESRSETRTGQQAPEQFKNTIDRLVDQLDIHLKDIRKKSVTVTDGGFSSNVEYDSFAVYHSREGGTTQEDVDYLTNNLKDIALNLKDTVGLELLDKISGTLIALRKINRGDEADRIILKLRGSFSTTDVSSEQFGNVKSALAGLVDIPDELYVKIQKTKKPKK